MRDKLTVKIKVETMFEDKPIELEFIKQAIEEKRDRILKDRGEGCIANNTTCAYLIKGICMHLMPDITIGGIRTTCGSYKYNPPVD
jgi:hypothetical protein